MSSNVEATEGKGLELPSPAIAEVAPRPVDEEQQQRVNGGGGQKEPGEDGPDERRAEENGEEDDVDEEGEEDEEPKLKYAKLTGSLTGVYRNGDSTSAFTVAGDKMIMGTHNGSVHVMSLPSLQGLRSYRGHQATVTSMSVSPVPPPPTLVKSDKTGESSVLSPGSPAASMRDNSVRSQPRAKEAREAQLQQQQAVPNTPNNSIYIATSSQDGHVCIQSLLDPKDVQLRNFARPLNAVALSPDYKNDRTYLSGGLSGQLVLTTGGKAGVSETANLNSTSAVTSGWLGSIGLGSNTGKDTVLHSGEGSISTIKWSLSGKWVCWVNEEGIKIMRSHLRLGSEESEDAWRRIAHAQKPNRQAWREMGGVWRARCEWVDERRLESDEHDSAEAEVKTNGLTNGTLAKTSTKKGAKKIEKLVVGWGDMAYILHVSEGHGFSAHSGQKSIGSADIVHKLQFRDCIVSGLSLYTPSLLAILAYRTRDDDDKPIEAPSSSAKSGGRTRHRRTGLAPQLRLVNVKDGEEVDLDELSISRFETLSAQDYHLGTLWMPAPLPEKAVTEKGGRGALQAVWEASGGTYAERLFSSSASVMSGSSSGRDEKGTIIGKHSVTSPRSSVQGVQAGGKEVSRKAIDAHPLMETLGLKLVIQSPYDCVLAVKRGLADRLEWLLERERYEEAWTLLDEHPDILDSNTAASRSAVGSDPGTPSRTHQQQQSGTLVDFFADSSSSNGADGNGMPGYNAPSQKEKRRIGDLWLQQLIAADQWTEAGKIAGKVLGTSERWEHWVWTFAQADRFDEITPSIPSTRTGTGREDDALVGGGHDDGRVLPSLVYELVLGHYIQVDRVRLKGLLEGWDPEMFDVRSVIGAVEGVLRSGEVSEKTVEGGEKGRDWRILTEALGKLYLADGRAREALRCYIRTQNPEAAMSLIKEGGMVEAVGEDVPGLVMLGISEEQMRKAPLSELEEASSEAVGLLVEEALRGTVTPDEVIRQLERKGERFQPFLFFYLRSLWRGGAGAGAGARAADDQAPTFAPRSGKIKRQRKREEGCALVEDHADLAVRLFAEYDRELLMTFLQTSHVYNYEHAAQTCEQRHYIPELVHVLSRMGQAKRALWLIIGELGDVKQAIAFAKGNGELWDDLLEYSMDKPRFIRGLLEEVGTAIDPVKMVRRIPEGLEINGLKDGIQSLVREHEVQYSISEGVARVLRGEVGVGMDTLRAGRKKGVRFEVLHELHGPDDVDLAVKDVETRVPDGEVLPVGKRKTERRAAVKPGHCVGCGDQFSEEEREPLLGFACGHVYHLSCLLRANPDTADEDTIERLLDQLGVGRGNADDAYSGCSVGGKVAHAHIIKNVVRGGCQHCLVPEGA